MISLLSSVVLALALGSAQARDFFQTTPPTDGAAYGIKHGDGQHFNILGQVYTYLLPQAVTGPGNMAIFTVSGPAGASSNAHFHPIADTHYLHSGTLDFQLGSAESSPNPSTSTVNHLSAGDYAVGSATHVHNYIFTSQVELVSALGNPPANIKVDDFFSALAAATSIPQIIQTGAEFGLFLVNGTQFLDATKGPLATSTPRTLPTDSETSYIIPAAASSAPGINVLSTPKQIGTNFAEGTIVLTGSSAPMAATLPINTAVWVGKGSGVVTFNGAPQTLATGDFAYFPKGSKVSVTCASGCTLYTMAQGTGGLTPSRRSVSRFYLD